VSSRKTPQERRIDELSDLLTTGDQLLVAELSRLGRNMLETLNIITALNERGIRITFVRQPELSTTGTHGKLLLAIYSYIAETERDFISLRTKQGFHDERRLFEMLTLEGMQAGLSWSTILRRRDAYRAALDNFDLATVARYSEAKRAELLANPGLIRNRLKIESIPANARAFLAVQETFGSFDSYLWRFVDGVPIQPARQTSSDTPASTPLSMTLSKDLKKRGFHFVGATICYALMQSVGLVNDHLVHCYRHRELAGNRR
jgi:DNA-3-methyladenine glycosylase I